MKRAEALGLAALKRSAKKEAGLENERCRRIDKSDVGIPRIDWVRRRYSGLIATPYETTSTLTICRLDRISINNPDRALLRDASFRDGISLYL